MITVPSLSGIFRALPAIIWMSIIFILSSQSDVPNPAAISQQAVAIVGHVFTFGLLAVLVMIAISTNRLSLAQQLLIAFCVIVAYGVIDELHQAFVPGRTSTAFDVVVDAAGGAIALAIYSLLVRKIDGSRQI